MKKLELIFETTGFLLGLILGLLIGVHLGYLYAIFPWGVP